MIVDVEFSEFQCMFKRRVIGCCTKECYANVNDSVVLEVYKYFKNSFGYTKDMSGPSCSKLTTSLVHDSLNFTSSDTQIC